MSLFRVLFNRLILLISFCGLMFFLNYKQGISFHNFFDEIDLSRILTVAGPLLLIYEVYKILRKIIRRNKAFQFADLKNAPTSDPLNRTRMSFMDKYLRIYESAVHVQKKERIILVLDQDKKSIAIHGTFGKKTVKFDAIEYLYLEYNHYELDNILYFRNLDTMVWKNTFKLKLKSGKHLRLFQGKFVEKEHVTQMEYLHKNNYEINDYSKAGERVLQLFSYLSNKKYMILNHTK